MTMPGIEGPFAGAGERADGVEGDVGGEREEGDGDDPQGGLFAGGELPGDRRGGGHLDHGVQSEADQRGRGGDRASGEGDGRLNDVAGDAHGDQQPDAAGERVAAGRGRGRGRAEGISRPSAAVLRGGVRARLVGLDRHHGGQQVLQGVAEPVVGELVASAAPVRNRDDEAAVAQASQVVGQPGPRDAQRVGKVGRVGPGLAQLETERRTSPLAGQGLGERLFGVQ